jgi:hypothetical protein
MKKSLVVLLRLLLSLLVGWMDSAEAEPISRLSSPATDPLYGRHPDKSVRAWIRTILLTPRTGSSPIIFVSPTEFEVHSPQYLIHLPKIQYGAFADYSRASRCDFIPNKFLPSEALEITEHSGEHERILCRMSLTTACRYLDGMRTLPGIDWTELKWKPLKRVRTGFNCK